MESPFSRNKPCLSRQHELYTQKDIPLEHAIINSKNMLISISCLHNFIDQENILDVRKSKVFNNLNVL